jgi:ribonuclease Z
MRPAIRVRTVNGPFRDPVIFLDFLYEKRALLFDAGDIRNLMPREMLRISDVFVSHTHMDHFADLDWLLRVCLGRDMTVRLFGPEGFIERMTHKLGAYTWNLVKNYEADLRLEVTEVQENDHARRALFSCRSAFRPRQLAPLPIREGVLVDETACRVRTVSLDHGGIPCLGFAFEEKLHVNIWKNRLEAMGLPAGPWLTDLKNAVLAGSPDITPIRAWWRDGDRIRERHLPLGDLRRDVVKITPGTRIGYLVDFADTPRNRELAVRLVRGADHLYIEAPFLHEETALARRKGHLTARQAGEIARAASVREMTPLHFSPRNSDREQELVDEAMTAFRQ